MLQTTRTRSESSPDGPPQIPFTAELMRKSIHLGAIVIPIFVLWYGREVALYILIPLCVLGFVADFARARLFWFNRLIRRLFGFMMRRTELPPVGGSVKINGATWVLLSAVFTFGLFTVPVAVAAFGFMILGDTAAAIVGRRFGRLRYPHSYKTVEGSLAFVVTGTICTLVLPGISLAAGIVGALAGAIAEAVPRPFSDNVRIPLAAGAAMSLMQYLF